MAEVIQKIIFKRGTKAALEAKLIGSNIPSQGEPIFETDTYKFKIGDGEKSYAELPYISGESGEPAAYLRKAEVINEGKTLRLWNKDATYTDFTPETGGTYTAGNGIKIVNQEISIDEEIVATVIQLAAKADKTELEAEISRATARENEIEAKIPSIEGLATKEYVDNTVGSEQSRAEGIESAISARVTTIEGDYLKASDKTELKGKITAEESRAEGVEASLSAAIAEKSKVSASSAGTSTTEVNYITINDVEYKLAGTGSGQHTAAVYQCDPIPWAADNEAAKLAAIASKTAGKTLANGDIAIVKEYFAGTTGESVTKYQYTAYVYDSAITSQPWIAMDGNYTAENVYFNDDLTYTAAIGVLPAPSGSATLAAKGKNVREVLASILAKRIQPKITSTPAVSLSGMQSNEDVEIGTNISKSGTFTSTLSAGTYTYGPATGVTASAWNGEIKYTQGKSGTIATVNSASTAYSYSFQLGTDGTTINISFATTATHNAGTIAIDNLGDTSSPIIQIAAGTKSNSKEISYTCYRKMFYGTREDKSDLDSSKIRLLTGIKQQAKSGNSLAVSVPVGAYRVIIAVPSGRSVTSVHDRNGLGAEIFNSFKTETIAVEGANGYEAENYTVYYLDYSSANDKQNYYDVTIA